MSPVTYIPLISALVLALITLPLLFTFPPVGLACIIGSLLLAVLAVPGLVENDRQGQLAQGQFAPSND